MKIEFKSNIAPPIVIDPAKKGVGGQFASLLGLIQPKVTVSEIPLSAPVAYAPYGEPKEGLGLGVLVVVAVLALVGLITLGKIVVRR